jgi:hypothetical protein
MAEQIPPSLYLGGGAFGCIYYIGVVRALYEANIRDLTVYGNSAGALVGVLYILQMPASEIADIFSNIVTIATKEIMTNPVQITSYQLTQHHLTVFDIIHKHSPDAYKKCSGRLKIGVTTELNGFQWKDTFTSQADFFNALLCSFNIPYLCNYNAKINDVNCVDGGCGFVSSRDLPIDTLKILLAGTSENGLSANIPLIHRIFPPPKFFWEMYLKNGYDDMKYRIESGKVGQKLRLVHEIISDEFENVIMLPELQFMAKFLQQVSGSKIHDYSELIERYK